MLRVAYLDTHHISRLARFPSEVDCLAITELLSGGTVHLAMTWIHLQELSAPTFGSRRAVGKLLDSVPIAWAPAPDQIFDWEVRAAIRYAMTRERIDVSPFSESFVHAFGAPLEADIPIAEMLEAMAERPDLRRHFQEAADYGAQMDARFKKTAAVVRNPEEPILAHIRDLNARATPSGVLLERMLTPEEVFEAVGGLAAFPALNVGHSLARTRLQDEGFPSESNDVMDEWHACYAPYTDVIALDRRTAARFQMTHLPEASKVTAKLQDVPRILANRLTNAEADKGASD